MTNPSQFPDILTIAERDGEGGWKAEPPSFVKGEPVTMSLGLPADEEFGDWTGGTFDAVLRAAPGAAGDPLATFAIEVGTPVSGSTPVTFYLAGDEQGDLPAAPANNQLAELFMAVGFTPTGGERKTRITTRIMMRGAI